MKFVCAVCEKEHEGLPDVGYAAPWYYESLPEAGRGPETRLGDDFCRVGDDYFIRGCLELPIVGTGEVFSYGVWISVSGKNFARYREIFPLEDPPAERYVGWISNRIAGYPDTLKLVGAASVRPGNRRPSIELEPTDHPLSREQREGIPLARVVEIVSGVMHA